MAMRPTVSGDTVFQSAGTCPHYEHSGHWLLVAWELC
jgi:hypothetical protein